MSRLTRHLSAPDTRRVLGACLAVVIIAVLGMTVTSTELESDIATMLVYMVVVVGLYSFSGLSGVLSFGHVAFVMIGAYTAAWVSISPIQKKFLFPGLPGFVNDATLSVVPGALVAGLLAAIFAAVLAIALMRLSGIAASLATLSVLLITTVAADNWAGITHGQKGVYGIPQNTTVASALGFVLVTIAAVFWFERSRPGLRLRAAREDEPAARAVGVRIALDRGIGFIVSAFIAGVGGFLLAQFLGSFTNNDFYTQLTFLLLAMLVVGGIAHLEGAIVGVIVLTAVSVGLRQVETDFDIGPGLVELGLAVILLAILIFRPNGIMGRSKESSSRLLRRARRAATDGGGEASGEPLTPSEASRP